MGVERKAADCDIQSLKVPSGMENGPQCVSDIGVW